MAYVGTPIDTQNQFQSLQGKRFSGDGSTTAFTLDIAPSSVFDIEVFVENVRQDPNSAYGISGTTLTFTGAPPSGTNNIYVVHQAKAVGTIDVPASSVVPASLASNIISGQTELSSAPDDTDELLISDAGTTKRVDVSLIKSTNTPAFVAHLDSNQSLSNSTATKLTMTSEDFDTDSAFADSKFTVPSGKGGKYYLYHKIWADYSTTAGSDGEYSIASIYVNGSALGEADSFLNLQGSANAIGSTHTAFTTTTLSAGDTVEVVQGKVVMEAGDEIEVSANSASALDCVVSVLKNA